MGAFIILISFIAAVLQITADLIPDRKLLTSKVCITNVLYWLSTCLWTTGIVLFILMFIQSLPF